MTNVVLAVGFNENMAGGFPAVAYAVLMYVAILVIFMTRLVARAWMCCLCNDRSQVERVTLNPLRHFHFRPTWWRFADAWTVPLTLVCVPILTGQGWAILRAPVAQLLIVVVMLRSSIPIQVEYGSLRNRYWDACLINLAGPFSVMILGVLLFLAGRGFTSVGGGPAAGLLANSGIFSIWAFMWLIQPIPPSDGAGFLWNLFRLPWQAFTWLGSKSMYIWIALVLFGQLDDKNQIPVTSLFSQAWRLWLHVFQLAPVAAARLAGMDLPGA